MLINLRNAPMAGKKLPYDNEVEYLESTGTQYIDTGYSFNSASDKVELVFELLTTTPNYKWIFGAYDASKRLAIGSGDNADRRTFGYNASTSYNSSTYYTNGAHIFLADSTGASIDGQNFFGFADFSTTSHILLYTIPLNPSVFCSNVRIWSYKHYRNGVLVRDFIPVRVGTVGYMYDRVSGKLFGNAGTGDFVLGPDVVPVEWLEFTGTQRLLTDITPSVYGRNLKTSISYQLTSTASRQLSGSASSYFEFCSNGALVQSDASYPADLNRHTLDFIGWNISNSSRVLYDGQNIAQGGFIRSTNTSNHFTFGSLNANSQSNPLKAKVSSLSMEYQDATKFLHWLPVRVGTDATSWEGAMMDVLTRRVYRNAGTGAFGYGNDLKYPIPAE